MRTLPIGRLLGRFSAKSLVVLHALQSGVTADRVGDASCTDARIASDEACAVVDSLASRRNGHYLGPPMSGAFPNNELR